MMIYAELKITPNKPRDTEILWRFKQHSYSKLGETYLVQLAVRRFPLHFLQVFYLLLLCRLKCFLSQSYPLCRLSLLLFFSPFSFATLKSAINRRHVAYPASHYGNQRLQWAATSAAVSPTRVMITRALTRGTRTLNTRVLPITFRMYLKKQMRVSFFKTTLSNCML